jgi:hypothetical protein
MVSFGIGSAPTESSGNFWDRNFRKIMQNPGQGVTKLHREELIEQMHQANEDSQATIDPYSLKEVLCEYAQNASVEMSLKEYLKKNRPDAIVSKIQKNLNTSPRKVLKEIFLSLEKRGLGNSYSDIYNNQDCQNLINSIVALCTGRKLDLTNRSIEEHLSRLEPSRQNTFRNIAFGRLKEKFDPIDYSTDPAVEDPEQVRQVLKNAPRHAVLSVFDFIKTCLEENNDQYSKADLDLLMNLRAEIKTL